MKTPARSPQTLRLMTAAVGVALGLGVFGVAEWVARRGNTDRTQQATRDYQAWAAGPCYRVDGDRLVRVRPPQGPQMLAAPEDSVSLRKAPGVRRIVIVGESTGEMLERALAAAAGSAGCRHRVEVLQCSAAGALPEVAVRRAREALAYSPDVLVVALGHNFLLPGPPPPPRPVVGQSQLGRDLRGLAPGAAPPTNPHDPPRADRRDPPAMGREAYAAILPAARARGVAVMALLLASNLWFRPRADAAYVASPERALAWVRWARGDLAGAAAALAPAPGAPDDALRAFERAGFRAGLGAWADARRDLVAARDLEPTSTRATTATTAAIAEAARAGGAQLVDAEGLFAPLADHGIAGWDVFFDNCHPHPAPLDLLAGAVLRGAAPDVAEACLAPAPAGQVGGQMFQGLRPDDPNDPVGSAWRHLVDGPTRVFVAGDPRALDWSAYPDNGGWRRILDGPFVRVMHLAPAAARAVVERYDREVLARYEPAPHAAALAALGAIARDADRLELARWCLERSAAVAPAAPALVELALLRLRAREDAAARAALAQAARLDPSSAQVRHTLTALDAPASPPDATADAATAADAAADAQSSAR
jgi:hypothetical protein